VTAATASDRRRDRRISLPGYGVLRTRAWTGTEVFGGLVDVSASGVRLRVKPGAAFREGEVLAVDLEVTLPTAPPNSPPVRLWGCGSVVRQEDTLSRGTEVALRFETPLAVAEGFGAPVPSASRVPARAP
jgi:hypothetical protein